MWRIRVTVLSRSRAVVRSSDLQVCVIFLEDSRGITQCKYTQASPRHVEAALAVSSPWCLCACGSLLFSSGACSARIQVRGVSAVNCFLLGTCNCLSNACLRVRSHFLSLLSSSCATSPTPVYLRKVCLLIVFLAPPKLISNQI